MKKNEHLSQKTGSETRRLRGKTQFVDLSKRHSRRLPQERVSKGAAERKEKKGLSIHENHSSREEGLGFSGSREENWQRKENKGD